MISKLPPQPLSHQPPPDQPHPDQPHPSADAHRLRHRIDQGLTGDKVPARDPAAAPLGTDDEAGGVSSPLRQEPPARPESRIPPGQKKGGETFET